ncbi:Armadillo-like helical domain containing protein [Gracilaria domingensis]|nr:Armadillo-like helical domain containing protein [Gracilaria domingensis]
MAAFVSPTQWGLNKSRRPWVCPHRPRRVYPRSCAELPKPPRPADVRALITSKGKADQQKGLLLVRQLPTRVALELLKLCVETSDNEFIRSTATVSIGQLSFEDENVAMEAVRIMADLLATDEDYSVRAAAGAAMGYATKITPTAKSVLFDALTRALIEDAEWQVQFSCLASLGGQRDKRAVPILHKWLSSDNDLLVQAAVGALGDIGDSASVPELLKLLGSGDMMTRQRLAHALGSISEAKSEPSVIDALRTLSKDQSFAVREAAEAGLKEFGCGDPVKEDSRTDEELIEAEVSNLINGDESGSAVESASDALRRRLERSFDKEYVHPSAFKKISESEASKDMQAFALLVDDLKAGSPLARVMAAIHLRKFDGQLAAEAAVSCNVFDPKASTERLRAVCVGLLAKGGDLEQVIHILKTDPDQNVRSACCDALLDLGGGTSAVEACIDTFQNDPHWLVRVSSAITLGTIGKGSEQVEEILVSSLSPDGVKDMLPPQDTVIHRHVVTALGFLGSRKALRRFGELIRSNDTDQSVRYRIAAALRGIHCEQSAALVRLLIEDKNESVAEMAQGTLDALLQFGFS